VNNRIRRRLKPTGLEREKPTAFKTGGLIKREGKGKKGNFEAKKKSPYPQWEK